LATNANQALRAFNTALMIESGVGLRTGARRFEESVRELVDILEPMKQQLFDLAESDESRWTR
jgi:hypothetical protein